MTGRPVVITDGNIKVFGELLVLICGGMIAATRLLLISYFLYLMRSIITNSLYLSPGIRWQYVC